MGNEVMRGRRQIKTVPRAAAERACVDVDVVED